MNISARNTQPTQTADALSYLFIYTSIELSEGGWFSFYLDKMTAIPQTLCSGAFSWMKRFVID